jgi:IS30 family transposase
VLSRIRDSTDNGSEFSNPSAIEYDENGLLWTNIYYCDPNCSYQKGSIENGHRLIRTILPKGTSFNEFTQNDIYLMMSHINSYRRKSLGGQTPIEVFARQYGNKMLKLLGIFLVEQNEIDLTTKLLKH